MDAVDAAMNILGANTINTVISADKIAAEIKKKIDANTAESYPAVGSVIAEARQLLGDSVSPYRWDDSAIAGFSDEAKEMILRMRPDCGSAVPEAFRPAILMFTVSRCYQLDTADASTASGMAIANTNIDLFSKMVSAVAPFIRDTEILSCVNEAIAAISGLRQDLNGIVTTAFEAAATEYAMTRIAQKSGKAAAFDQFNRMVSAVARYWNRDLLAFFQKSAFDRLKSLRPDAFTVERFSGATVNYIVGMALQSIGDNRSTSFIQLALAGFREG